MPAFPISEKGGAVHPETWQLSFTLSPSSLSTPGASPSPANFASIFRYQFPSRLFKSAPKLACRDSNLRPTPDSYPHSRRNRPSHRPCLSLFTIFQCLSLLTFWAVSPDSARKPGVVCQPPVPPCARAHGNSRAPGPVSSCLHIIVRLRLKCLISSYTCPQTLLPPNASL